MRKTITLISCLLAIIALMSISGSCSKEDQNRGTLTIKVWSPDGDIYFNVYPYVADYDNLTPIAEAKATPQRATVNFDLNVGNYVVIGKAKSFECKTSVQIKSNDNIVLEVKGSQFSKQ